MIRVRIGSSGLAGPGRPRRHLAIPAQSGPRAGRVEVGTPQRGAIRPIKEYRSDANDRIECWLGPALQQARPNIKTRGVSLGAPGGGVSRDLGVEARTDCECAQRVGLIGAQVGLHSLELLRDGHSNL